MNPLLQKTPPSEDAQEPEDRHSARRLPTSDDYAKASRRRAGKFLLGGAVLASVAAGAFVGQGKDNILLPLTLLAAFLIPILLWRFPRLVFYFVLAAACLFETALLEGTGSGYSDSITDRIPIFWNFNTILQQYGHMDFKAIPLNLLEMLLLIAGLCAFVRSAYTKTASFHAGALIWPISVYMAFVALAWLYGMATGGDFKISLQEIRSQFYFGLAYLMAFNMIRDRTQLQKALWIIIICVGFKGVLLTFRRYVTLHGLPLPDQGVGAHEEAFFFDAFVILLLSFSVCGTFPKMRWTMLGLLPFVILGSLACNRRAGTAAFIIILPVLALAAYQALPSRRRMITVLSVVAMIAFMGYYFAFKNSSSILAQPARAIDSQFHPDPRDASSNAYRDAENADLMATIRSAPLGYGYGKKMLHAVPIADISNEYEWWDIMTHNQVLWVWMRVGALGFLAFWMMISAILICAARTIQNERIQVEMKSVAISGMLIVGALMIFGLLDLQFSNFRDMLFTGLWCGIIAGLPGLAALPARSGRTGAES
ncbi:MAG: O-antigen ligase family protein [Janthinobacterium lividum]